MPAWEGKAALRRAAALLTWSFAPQHGPEDFPLRAALRGDGYVALDLIGVGEVLLDHALRVEK
jgi:hypothetical protein